MYNNIGIAYITIFIHLFLQKCAIHANKKEKKIEIEKNRNTVSQLLILYDANGFKMQL